MLLRGNSEPKEANLHRIFGKEENVAYLDRRGAYIIPIKGEEKERVCSAETYYEHPTIGFFHPIQVYYSGKLVKKLREPVEQDHVFRWVKYEDLRGKMCLEMQNWAVEQVWNMC